MNLRFTALASVVCLAFAPSMIGCGSSLPPAFPLEWQGVDSAPSPSPRVKAALAGKNFHMEATVDKRSDQTKVGVDNDTRYQFRTTSSVADFCTTQIHEMLNASGVRLVEQGDYIVQSEIGEFNVAEGGLFNGEVRITFRVFAPGKPAFEALYEGKSKRFGRDHSVENINEALSNALASATEKFLQDDAFADALEGKLKTPGAAPTEAPAAPAAPPAGKPAPAKPAASAPAKPAASGKGQYSL